ncbi:hypothetical protein FQR65_LT05901 [Abscondita terminalis]|nr:hypothetical protein FQR65_LT05901 [Abscondita terminalis]
MFAIQYIKIVLVIFSVCGGELSVPFQEAEEDLLQVFAQFVHYDVILHFDNFTKNVLDRFIFRIDAVFFIINYDGEVIQPRPSGYKFLNIIYLRNVSEFERFSYNYTSIQKNDVMFFLSGDVSLQWPIIWKISNLNQSLGLLVYNLQSRRLHYKCFYCGLNSTFLQEVVTRRFPKIPDYLMSYSNFHEHVFHIGYMPFAPFFWCNAPPRDCVGPEANLLQVLSKKLNFQYTLQSFENATGTKGTWRTMVETVHNRSLDFGLGGVSQSPERSDLTDLTRAIHSEVYAILFQCHVSETWNSWQQVLKPFSFSLWVCILFTFASILILLTYLPDSVKLDTAKHIEIMVRGIFEQPLRFLPINYMTKRLVFIIWLYTCIILITAYKSKVVSMMISSDNHEFSSIEDLLNNGYTFQVSSQDWSLLREYWEASAKSDQTIQTVMKQIRNDLPTCDAVEKMINNKVVYIDERSHMLYKVTHCPAYVNSKPPLRLCLIGKDVCPSNHVWALQLGAGYRHRFSYLIENLRSAGILPYWYKSALEEVTPKSKNVQDATTSALTLATIAPSIFVLGFGLAISSIIFTAEIMYHHSEKIVEFLNRFTF